MGLVSQEPVLCQASVATREGERWSVAPDPLHPLFHMKVVGPLVNPQVE